MKNFNYFAPTEVVFGNGKIKETGEMAARYGKKAILVTMPEFSEIAPVYRSVMDSLKKSGVEFIHFDGVIANPTTDIVTQGAEMAKAFGAEVAIGLGGGSSIDVAKAIAVEATHPGSAWDYLFYKEAPTDKTLPIIAIGTTAGTGSQTTLCSVITKSDDKDKSAIWHPNIFPRVALVDPETTKTMPAHITAQTGFDAFTHNFEAYISVETNPMVETLALEAIRLIAEYLPRAVENGDDMEARAQMAWADTLGGFTNSSGGVTLPHGLGMQVGGHCPYITHGQALAAIYPEFMRYTYASDIKKFAAAGRIFNPSLADEPDEIAAEKSCEALDGFLKKIGLWIGFKELGATLEDMKEIAAHGQVLVDYKRNPKVATLEDMEKIMLASYER